MARLEDVCTIVSGTTPRSDRPGNWDGDINWITPAELTDESDVIFASQRKITRQAVVESGLKSFPAGTVLLSSRAPIGKVAIAGTSMFCNQGFKNLICSDAIFNRYLYHFLKSKTDYLNQLGRGATFKEISKSIVGDVEIPLPSLDEQCRIASVLDKVSDLIAKRRRQLEKLDELVKARFVEMFGDLKENPMRWPKARLSELLVIERGGSPRPINNYITEADSGVNWIKIGDAEEGSIYITKTKQKIRREGAKKSRYVHPGDFILSNSMSFGRPYILKIDGYIHDGWLLLRDEAGHFNKMFLHSVLSSNYTYSCFSSMAEGGVVNNLNKELVGRLEIVCPPMKVQEQFAIFAEQVGKGKEGIICHLDKLETLKKALMQKYFD